MARKAGELASQLECKSQARRSGVEAALAREARIEATLAPAPDARRERADRIRRQAERLAHLADRAARAVVDHGRGDAGVRAAVLRVDVLDDLLAPLVLEVDVDVGRLLALGRDEALEQEIEALRVDRGNAEAVADRGVGRRAAPLAEDAARLGEAHDVVDGEEIRRVVELGDQGELVLEQALDLGGDALGIAFTRARPGQLFQMRLHAQARGRRVDRILISAARRGRSDRRRRSRECAPAPRDGLRTGAPSRRPA